MGYHTKIAKDACSKTKQFISKKAIMISITDINSDIQKSIRQAITAAQGKKLQEPDYTASLSIGLPNILKKSGKLPSNIKFGGCFTHQSPLAKFASAHKQMSCELGDLLILIRKKTTDGEIYNAALVQLKRSDNHIISIKSDGELKQLYLYKHWPCFSVEQLLSQYNVFPKTVTKGGVYGIIHEKSNNAFQIYTSEPMSTMQCNKNFTFGKFIVNLIDWQAGRTIADEYNKDSDEWSRLIWDIIRLVEHKLFNANNSSFAGQSKSTIDFFQSMLNNSFMDDGSKYTFQTNDNPESENSGFGILFVDVNNREMNIK